VWEIRTHQRPSYDLFSYRGSYYAYNNDQWYMSQRSSGDFRLIDDRYVPTELYRVPRDHWRSYPAAWDRDGRASNVDHQHHHGNDSNDHGHH
jgi:hypothetical protein